MTPGPNNGNGNGHGPIPFADPTIPIIGQPVTLKGWFPTAMIVCNCEAHPDPILIIGESIAKCPKCERQYVIGKVNHTIGQPPAITIGVVTSTAPPPV